MNVETPQRSGFQRGQVPPAYQDDLDQVRTRVHGRLYRLN